MSLFIGFISQNSVYIGVDGRISQDIPIVGEKYYDFCEKLATLGEDGKLWMAGVGQIATGSKVFDELVKKSILNIDEIKNINEKLFEKIHKETLNAYNITYNGPNDLINCLVLLFGGINKDSKPEICLIDSANGYLKKNLTNAGDFIFNRIDNGSIDKYIATKLRELSLSNNLNDFDYFLITFKEIFSFVAKADIGVSRLMYFVKISNQEVVYREFHRIRRVISKIKFKFDNLIYFGLLKLHKLNKVNK